MYRSDELSVVDPAYFNIITKDKHDITIQSRNTGHWWYLHNTEYPTEGSTLVYHKHQFNYPFHEHQRTRTLRQAVRSIKRRDQWQMNGRK